MLLEVFSEPEAVPATAPVPEYVEVELALGDVLELALLGDVEVEEICPEVVSGDDALIEVELLVLLGVVDCCWV